MAAKCLDTADGAEGETSMSPRLRSISSASFNATDCPRIATSRSPSKLTIDCTLVRWRDGSASTSSGYTSIIAFDPTTEGATTLGVALPIQIGARAGTWVWWTGAGYICGGAEPLLIIGAIAGG